MKKILFGMAAVAASLVLTGDVNAGCPTPKLFGTFDNGRGLFTYVTPAAGADNTSLVGRFWQSGNRSLANEGGYDDSAWLRQYGTNWYVSGDLSDSNIVGCPGTAMSLLIQDTRNGQFAFARVAEDLAQALPISYATVGGDMVLSSTPAPRLTNRVPNATGASWTVVIDPTTSNFYTDGSSTRDANITGYQLVQQRRPVGQAVDNNAASWTNVGAAVPAAGGTVALTVDCTAQDLVYVGVRPVFDGGGFSGDVVSGRAQVSCTPTMADPGKGFKIIDRKSGAKRETSVK